jgi:hypothetical protein
MRQRRIERRHLDGRRESKEKSHFYNYAYGRGEASRSRLGRRPSGPQGWPGRKQGKRISELKFGFLNLSMLWKFVEGDLGEILTWGFFLNSSMLLKDFRKI